MKYRTYGECKDKLREVENISENNNLEYAVIFRTNMVTGLAEHRVIFSDNQLECRMWLDDNMKNLYELDIPYVAYLSGQFQASHKFLFE